ncbi:S6A14 protein, partial [Polypterus senegalus]
MHGLGVGPGSGPEAVGHLLVKKDSLILTLAIESMEALTGGLERLSEEPECLGMCGGRLRSSCSIIWWPPWNPTGLRQSPTPMEPCGNLRHQRNPGRLTPSTPGAFLIPYTIMLAFAGLPLFFLECSFGQFASLGPVSVWKAVPIMQGVGVTMVLVSALVAIYYNCIIGYSIYYLFASFQFPLPWSDCFEWSDENCSKQPKEYCNITSENGSFVLVNSTWLNDNNATCEGSNIFSISVQSPSEQYWDKVALRRSSGLDESGGVIWHLALCLLLAWIIVGAALFKGIKSSGKVVYFTAIFPYVVLIILLIRGVTLEGAREGIEYYIGTHSDISKLSDAEVWKDAATQIFFSLSTAWGGLVALSSYNKFNNNCYSDAIVVCVTNCATSVFAGFVIFSVLGHIAHISHKPVSEVAQSGIGLAFIAYPEALSKLPISPLWSTLFFFMLLTLGIDSQFAIIETITTALQDEFPKYLRSRRALITVVVCVVLYLLGLPCVTGAPPPAARDSAPLPVKTRPSERYIPRGQYIPGVSPTPYPGPTTGSWDAPLRHPFRGLLAPLVCTALASTVPASRGTIRSPVESLPTEQPVPGGQVPNGVGPTACRGFKPAKKQKGGPEALPGHSYRESLRSPRLQRSPPVASP